MGRLLILILLIVLAAWLVRRALRRMAQQDDAGTAAPRTQTTDELVRCAHCSVLLPRAEARLSAGTIYCSEEHARLGPGTR